jgi:hypothetical protein
MGIGFNELFVVSFLVFLLPCIIVLASKRAAGAAKFGWLIIAFFFSWIGLAAFFIMTQKTTGQVTK